MARRSLQARRGISDIEGADKQRAEGELLLEAQRLLGCDTTKAEIKESGCAPPAVREDWLALYEVAPLEEPR